MFPTMSSGSVKITNIDLSAEIATITNTGTSAVELTGWRLVFVALERSVWSLELPRKLTKTLTLIFSEQSQTNLHGIYWNTRIQHQV